MKDKAMVNGDEKGSAVQLWLTGSTGSDAHREVRDLISSTMRSLSCSPWSSILSVHHYAMFKLRWVESGTDKDKGNKRRKYVV